MNITTFIGLVIRIVAGFSCILLGLLNVPLFPAVYGIIFIFVIGLFVTSIGKANK